MKWVGVSAMYADLTCWWRNLLAGNQICRLVTKSTGWWLNWLAGGWNGRWLNCWLVFFNFLQATLEEKKKLEDELKALKEKNAEQQKFIGALKSAISHLSWNVIMWLLGVTQRHTHHDNWWPLMTNTLGRNTSHTQQTQGMKRNLKRNEKER